MPPSKTDGFLDMVCAQIHWPHARYKVRRELAGHIEDRIQYLMEKRGYSYEEAEETAVNNMGDPIEIGIALNDQHRAGPCLLCIAITVVFWIAILSAAYLLVHDLGWI